MEKMNMKKIVVTLALMLTFLGCSSKGGEVSNVEPSLVVGKSLQNLRLNDQFEKPHTLDADTKTLIFAFSKDMAHTCNDFFATQTPTYLVDNHAEFIADVSAAPSLIRSMFIMPGLKDFKHTVLIFEEESKAAPFRAKMDTEKIVVISLNNGTITKITPLSTAKELQEKIEAK